MSTITATNRERSTGALPLEAAANDDQVLVDVRGVRKKFCRSLKRSLWYGVKDIAGELVPASRPSASQPHDSSRSELRKDEFWAVDGVSFQLRRGECLGLIGHNGAGKTTLLKMLNGLIKPDGGQISMRGRVGALIALGAGFNPILSGRENIYVNAAVLGLSKRETEDKLDEIIDFTEIEEFIDSPVQSYSSGMQVRLGFAVATALDPDVLILDEVLAVGDATFRAKCFARIGKVLDRAAVIFVSHSESQVQRICNRGLFMSKGRPEYLGDTASALIAYRSSRTGQADDQRDWICGDDVRNATSGADKTHLKWGDKLVFRVNIVCDRPISVSNLYIQWHRQGIAFMESHHNVGLEAPIELNAGPNELLIESSPVHLAEGKYDVSFAAFASKGKQTVAHTYCAVEIQVEGPLGAGPAVQSPCTITCK
ncbi:ABC transporter ATP-binding protein [Roseiconus nitratireducens]|uniref:ABC transporter ATP-binding protein n=1 Tax=Roseiconus nitratireducens TaxID=2605748 RepID=A0A5M6DIC6_9BACT|nr:ABC transporter ATP-binding protein [Roseiconus nitratireducens]KAA5546126.1 ABC transporter ATP-binding protein [Roseiconus nitratireducens]